VRNFTVIVQLGCFGIYGYLYGCRDVSFYVLLYIFLKMCDNSATFMGKFRLLDFKKSLNEKRK
jgi:hypothetical protein